MIRYFLEWFGFWPTIMIMPVLMAMGIYFIVKYGIGNKK